jgi:hypothetical protein
MRAGFSGRSLIASDNKLVKKRFVWVSNVSLEENLLRSGRRSRRVSRHLAVLI